MLASDMNPDENAPNRPKDKKRGLSSVDQDSFYRENGRDMTEFVAQNKKFRGLGNVAISQSKAQQAVLAKDLSSPCVETSTQNNESIIRNCWT